GGSGPDNAGGGGSANTCSPGAPCGSGFFCDYADNKCGKGSATGTCHAAPISDCGPAPLACGCDGAVRESCGGSVGLGASVDIGDPTTCETPAGFFNCGLFYCDTATEYCQGAMNLTICEVDYACAPIPGACAGAPTCDCLVKQGVGTCSGDAASGFT